ncbi:unnamed protein product [Callosobruchus maculatus]|uniref:Uncharacterized protein n=1 Tax=Callosobruchus maculatus TaxID=64391 RepID=A0A653DI99_CALMS|nr:unnamed protein product [Callosobruchus maculatus]
MVVEQHPTLLNVTLHTAKPWEYFDPPVTSPPKTILSVDNTNLPIAQDERIQFPDEKMVTITDPHLHRSSIGQYRSIKRKKVAYFPPSPADYQI